MLRMKFPDLNIGYVFGYSSEEVVIKFLSRSNRKYEQKWFRGILF